MNPSYPHIRGQVARQAHVAIPEGLVEEEYARGGFSGAYAHLYRKNAPVAWSRIEGPLKPRAYDLNRIDPDSNWIAARKPLLGNADVKLSFAQLAAPMNHFFRNADGDELLFVHQGAGRLETDFGPLPYHRGDYLLIPRGTVYRLAPVDKSAFLVIETRGELAEPDRGMLGQHALWDPAVVEVPTPIEDANSTLPANAQGEYELVIQRLGELTHVFYPHCPLDVVGWKGTLSVKRLNVADIRPVMSERYHLPPSAHSTFVAPGAIVCTFLPRALETGDPKAMKVPFYHSNIDFDEVLFYHDGEFFSRTGVGVGMLTFHPQGIHHGPQPGAIERTADKDRTNEVAVMLDTRQPLEVLTGPDLEVSDYWRSWSPKNSKT